MKDIQIEANKRFRVRAVQLQGDFVDDNGNPLDSGNSLVDITPTDSTALPADEVRAVLTPQPDNA